VNKRVTRMDAVEVFSQSKENASRVADEWEAHQGRAMDGSYRATVAGVDVLIRDIRFGEDEDGNTWVDVWTGNTRRPAFRITNPPTLVRDSRGPIAVKEADENGKETVVKHREDPVDAVAQVIAEVRRR
jgi:hypothetical protein